MKLSVNDEKKQIIAQNPMRDAVRNLLEGWQMPLLENEGVRVRNARTVPVGRRFARLAAVAKVLCTGCVIESITFLFALELIFEVVDSWDCCCSIHG